jgi:hypothetical protein
MSEKTSFFEELKRRNVVRVGVVYLIAAWLLAQVADLMLASFHAPEWVIQAILVVLIIGFPLALIFAWAYELTPEGLKKEKDVDRSQSITRKTGHTLDRSIIAILIVALGYFVWESQKESEPGSVGGRSAAESRAERAPTEPESASTAKSIAVLPFVNMSSDPEQEFLRRHFRRNPQRSRQDQGAESRRPHLLLRLQGQGPGPAPDRADPWGRAHPGGVGA